MRPAAYIEGLRVVDTANRGIAMYYALSWFFVSSLIGIWSLASWALHAITVWSAANVGALATPADISERLVAPGWMAAWIPPEAVPALKSMLAALSPAMETASSYAPSWAGGLSIAIWVLWGIGCLILLALGGLSHVAFAILRKRAFPSLARRRDTLAAT